MECNRDEAIQAITIAEGKLVERDFVGAKKFALKAGILYPGLEGISEMLTTLDVYIAAEKKISGEVDWYGILGVNPMADGETVRKQYSKLALLLHPDKNKSFGADGAFKLLSKAWSLLSDSSKRLAYNQRISSNGFQQEVLMKNLGRSITPSGNGYHNVKTRAISNPKTNNNTARAYRTSVPSPSYGRSDTFWTFCNRCKMHYEYLKVYLNNTLLCPNCHEPFLASEMAPPFKFSKSSNSASHYLHQNSSNHATRSKPGGSAGLNSFNHRNEQQAPFFGPAGFGIMDPSIAAKAAYVIQQANQKLKREREQSQDAAGWEKHLKQRRGLDDNGYCYGGNRVYQTSTENGSAGTRSISGLRKGGRETDGIYSKPHSTRELTPIEIQIMLMAKARIKICKKLNEWSSETVPMLHGQRKRR